VLGALLRISILFALPEAYYGPDSNSYFNTASSLWLKGKWEFPVKRRWVYPAFLVPAPALPGRPVAALAILQHTLGLLVTVLGIGWSVLHLTRRPAIWVPLATVLGALWPRMLWYEHEVVAEWLLLAGIIVTVALAFPVDRLREPRRLFAYLLAAAFILAVKPHARPIWLGLMIAATLLVGAPWRWPKIAWLPIGLSILIILTTGSSKQGPWLLLSSSFPLVDPVHGTWPEYRQTLRPAIEEARGDLSQYPWRQSRYKDLLSGGTEAPGLGPAWEALMKDDKKYQQVCRDLAVDAIRHAPFTYARMVLQKIGMVLGDDHAGGLMAPHLFWPAQVADTESRWTRHPDEMKLLYRLDHDGFLALAAEGQQRSPWYEPYLFSFTHTFSWMRTIKDEQSGTRSLHPAWIGLLALFGFVTCLLPGRWRQTSPLWFPVVLYLPIIFGIGDIVTRYLQPVEWVGIVFVALGLDWLLGAAWRPRKVES
jgi:hypothetical protein